ncbi:MAG: NAD(P)/FAD-dependent oxidoreductase [Alphaproteobacteria bacterium]
MKIAVIGSGISGLGAAYLLCKNHDVTLFEKNTEIGGHSRTIDINARSVKTEAQKSIAVDTGFIVFNDWNYPNLMGLFAHLGIAYEKSDMSFGVSVQNGWLEYSSSAMFAQKKNMIRPLYWGMIADILKFNKYAPAYIEKDSAITLGQCLDELNMGAWFRNYYLLAMGAAIWSSPIESILKFPAKTFLRFFKNHGLLSVNNRPQWYTVSGGSRNYTQVIEEALKSKGQIHKNYAVQKVICNPDKTISIMDQSGKHNIFDQVIFASHADEALTMIETPTPQEQNILGAFRYQSNKIIVHSDESFMPKNKNCWSSWVYLNDNAIDEKPCVSLSYWMNNLQNIDPDYSIFVTLNPDRRPQEELIYDEYSFTHPIFDQPAIEAQTRITEIQGQRGLWFCGAYQRYGFHEDGLWSAINVAKALGAKIPWQ